MLCYKRIGMFTPGILTFREFMTHESLPLATIHQTVLEFLRERSDVVLFGAQAVNVYVDEPRMSQDVDLLTHDADSPSQAPIGAILQCFYSLFPN